MGAALSLPRGAAAQAPRTISCGRSRAPSTCQTTGRRGELNIGDSLFAAAYLRDRPRNRKRTRAPLASFFRAFGGRRLTPAAAVTVAGVLVCQIHSCVRTRTDPLHVQKRACESYSPAALNCVKRHLSATVQPAINA